MLLVAAYFVQPAGEACRVGVDEAADIGVVVAGSHAEQAVGIGHFSRLPRSSVHRPPICRLRISYRDVLSRRLRLVGTCSRHGRTHHHICNDT